MLTPLVKQLADSEECGCGMKQTTEHLFCRCNQLTWPRSLLQEEIGYFDLWSLMTDHPQVAAEWALCFFPLEQFRWARVTTITRFTQIMFERSLEDMENVARHVS